MASFTPNMLSLYSPDEIYLETEPETEGSNSSPIEASASFRDPADFLAAYIRSSFAPSYRNSFLESVWELEELELDDRPTQKKSKSGKSGRRSKGKSLDDDEITVPWSHAEDRIRRRVEWRVNQFHFMMMNKHRELCSEVSGNVVELRVENRALRRQQVQNSAAVKQYKLTCDSLREQLEAAKEAKRRRRQAQKSRKSELEGNEGNKSPHSNDVPIFSEKESIMGPQSETLAKSGVTEPENITGENYPGKDNVKTLRSDTLVDSRILKRHENECSVKCQQRNVSANCSITERDGDKKVKRSQKDVPISSSMKESGCIEGVNNSQSDVSVGCSTNVRDDSDGVDDSQGDVSVNSNVNERDGSENDSQRDVPVNCSTKARDNGNDRNDLQKDVPMSSNITERDDTEGISDSHKDIPVRSKITDQDFQAMVNSIDIDSS